VRDAVARLDRQIAVQVLPDGGYYERSPSYHCQVLSDLIDVHELLVAAGCTVSPVLREATTAMRSWLGAMLLPDGDVPLFNDAWLIGVDRLRLLDPVEHGDRPLVVLQPSGYVVARPAEGTVLVADVGPPCPPDLPAHAHADCLSFVLCVNGERVIVDTGTSTYTPGLVRDYERSTRAHNTVEIDGRDQTEVWGAFRAGRRATPTLKAARRTDEHIEICASHDGYRRLAGRPSHLRTLRVGPSHVAVVDQVLGGGRHAVSAFLHLAPGLVARLDEHRRTVQAGPLTISAGHGPALTLHGPETDAGGWVATGFGQRQPAAVVSLNTHADLPVRLTSSIGW
ncbi:MAG: heparinase II/III domain-containing protein, partial [Egibacteraceae bacterium]